MAYDGTIPALGNLISNDIPAIQENFSLLDSAQVVDEGTTADGDYIRYENGWQICIARLTDIVDITTPYGSLYKSSDVTWNFPVSFVSYPAFAALPFIQSRAGFATNSGSTPGNTSISFNFATNTSTTGVTVYYRAIAIGRWK